MNFCDWNPEAVTPLEMDYLAIGGRQSVEQCHCCIVGGTTFAVKNTDPDYIGTQKFHPAGRFARITSAFEMNNMQRGDVTLSCGLRSYNSPGTGYKWISGRTITGPAMVSSASL